MAKSEREPQLDESDDFDENGGDICGEFDCVDGWILNDCFEDTCCCADPEAEHGYRPCPMCNADGKK